MRKYYSSRAIFKGGKSLKEIQNEMEIKMYSLLIVDDEPLTREYMKLNISSIHEGWAVAGEAGDGTEALEFIGKQSVDLVITDIKMPVMDGLELCRTISQTYPKLKVIILSGYDEFAYAKEAILYGVNEYLLKPVVKEDLKAALDSIAKKLDQEKNYELAYKSLLNLSIDSKGSVVKKFLQALINESAVEIKTLYPLIFRMKVSLMEGEGMILILALDEGKFLKADLPVSDISIYRYILNRAATEMVEEDDSGWVFLDPDENTCILFTGEDTAMVRQSCIDLAAKVNSFMCANTHLAITASIGCPVNDILQLSLSYKNADKLLLCSLFKSKSSLYTNQDQDIDQYLKRVDEIFAATILLKSGFMGINEMNCYLALSKLADLIDYTDVMSVLRCGVYIIKNLSPLKADSSPEFVESAMKLLKTFSSAGKSDLSRESTIKLFKSITAFLSGNTAKEEGTIDRKKLINEESIIEKAKEYIFSHYSEPISLALIAENAGISSSYLSQMFHKAVGESYIQFLTKVRMEQASKLLKAYPDEKISNICEKVGYMGVKHFSYVFKQYFNMTPGEFQNKAYRGKPQEFRTQNSGFRI